MKPAFPYFQGMCIALLLGCFTPCTQAEVIFVNKAAQGANNGTSWTDAYIEFRVALPTAGSGDEIWVAKGTYTPTAQGSRGASFYLKNDVAIYGGFDATEISREDRDWLANPTILSGDLAANDTPPFGNNSENTYRVVRAVGLNSSSILDGFQIVGGNANGSGSDFTGAGIYVSSASPTFRNCTLRFNRARYGAAMSFYDISSPTFVNCTFETNQSNEHAAVFWDSGYANRIAFYSCSFLGNVAPQEGGVATTTSSGELLMVNCLFSGNSAGLQGGALFLEGKDAEFINCTFSNNQSTTETGGVYVGLYGASANFQNCILWGNSDATGTGEAAQFYSAGSFSPITVEYSVIQGWSGQLGGVGVIDVDPFFVDADGPDNILGTADDDTRLGYGSPCVDTGRNDHFARDVDDVDGDGDTIEFLLADLDGTTRFADDPFTADGGHGQSPIIDMGAYEYHDCDRNAAPDYLDIQNGGAEDCAGDGILDQCEPDCNDNGEANSCDILSGFAADCDRNGIPDDCDLATGQVPDCNINSIPDSCDIASALSGDCNGSGIPDECYWQKGKPIDCNANNTSDECDADCNRNAKADECDITDGASADCDSNGVPDECQPDCNQNGVADPCDLGTGTSFDENGDGYPDECQIVFVDSAAQGNETGLSWADAYSDLQDALLGLPYRNPPITEIWVASGTYRPTGYGGALSVSFDFPEGVELFGGFSGIESSRDQRDWRMNETILSGDLNQDDGPKGENRDDNSQRIAIMTGDGVLDGFTLRAGNNTTYGGALYITYSNPTIRHCRFSENSAIGGGAVYNTAGSPKFEDCEFVSNTATTYGGGAVYTNTSDATAPLYFVDCRFVDNHASDNGGAMIIICGGGWCPEFINCTWTGNTATEYGGAVWHSWNYSIGSTFVNGLFSGNSAAGTGGAIYVDDSFPSLHNCTISGNSADIVGGLYAIDEKFGAGLNVYNSILWANSDSSGTGESAQFDDTYQNEIDFSYCSVQGWTGKAGGIANNGDDPLFVDANGIDNVFGTEDDNARLSPYSPSIDSADNASVPTDEFDVDADGDVREAVPFDLEHSPRFVDDPDVEDTGVGTPPIVDRGAYEFQKSPGCEGDVNADFIVDPLDSGYVLSRLSCPVGQGDPLCDAADANLDGIVDPLDAGYVLSRFGACP